jgi:hypothetical protein
MRFVINILTRLRNGLNAEELEERAIRDNGHMHLWNA